MRPILPILSVPVPLANGNFDRKGGLGDIKLPMFLASSRQTGFIWALGTTLGFPSSTDPDLGTEKWSAGPNGVAVYVGKKWVVGAIITQQWSYAGKGSREDVSTTSLQYSAWYIHPSGWEVGSGHPDYQGQLGSRQRRPLDSTSRARYRQLLKIPRMPVQINLEASYRSGASGHVRRAVELLADREASIPVADTEASLRPLKLES